MRIVEFGCGTGTTAVHHTPHVQHIDAIDISAKMLEIERQWHHGNNGIAVFMIARKV